MNICLILSKRYLRIVYRQLMARVKDLNKKLQNNQMADDKITKAVFCKIKKTRGAKEPLLNISRTSSLMNHSNNCRAFVFLEVKVDHRSFIQK